MISSRETWLTAFIDETGNHDLVIEKAGASNLFICVAVLVNEKQSMQVAERMRRISLDDFSGTEVKSSGIGGKHRRRLQVLEKIKDLQFGYYALIVNKSEIDRTSGLQYKPVFYKYLNRMLYSRLLNSGTSLNIVADSIGGKPFMDSFLPYLKRKGQPDLFTTWSHQFADSATTPQIQLADLIAGTLSYCFDEAKVCEHSKEYRTILRPKELDIDCWPPVLKLSTPPLADASATEWDDHIHICSINRALKFTTEFEGKENLERRMQVFVLRHLMFIHQYEPSESPTNMISDELIRILNNQGFPKLSRQQFSSKVIGPLRDWGILISGGSDGYRLACNTADIHRYLSHDTNIIRPMLARLKIARRGLRQDTSNQYDILQHDDFAFLRVLVDAMLEHSIKEGLPTRSNIDEILEAIDITEPDTERTETLF